MSETGPQRAEVCVGAVVVRDGRLLLVERGRGSGVGLWSIPGGRVEPGETLVSAVERELFEETGLRGTCGDFIGWVERIDDTAHYVILDFTVRVDAGDPVAGDDAAAVRWVLLDALDSVALVPGLARFFAEHGIIAA